MNISSNGIIRGFARCTPIQFERMRADLEITLPDPLLERLVICYREQFRREPHIGELRFLDRLAALPKDPYTAGISELHTDDAEIQKALSDLLKRHRFGSNGTEKPLTLGGLFCIALSDPVRKEPLPRNLPMWLSYADPELFGTDGITVANSPFSLRLPGYASHAEKPQTGDLFLLLRPGERSPADYAAEANAFCSSPDVCTRMRGVLTIGAGGIFDSILTCLHGAHVDLCRLDRFMEDLLRKDDAGCKLILLPKPEAKTVVDAARSAGFDPCVFTSVTQNGSFDFRLQTGEILSFPVGFLREFRTPEDRLDLSLSPEKSIFPTGIGHLLNRPGFDRIPTKNGYTVAAASCSMDSSPFRKAIATVCAAISPQILSGSNPEDCRFAVGVEIPADGSATELSAATALGLYRAKEEFGSIYPVISLQSSPTAACPKLTVFSISDVNRTVSHFQVADAGIYAVQPPFRQNGLPDFRAFREMMKTLSGLVVSSRIHAVGTAVSEPPTDALCRMRTSDLREELTDQADVILPDAPLTFFLVSNEPIPFPRIGTVIKSAQISGS